MTISVRFDDETRRLLTRLARSHRVPQSEIVRRAIRALAKSDPATEEIDVYGRCWSKRSERAGHGSN